MTTSFGTNTICPLARREFSLQASMAESYRCARELDDSVARFCELFEKVACSRFVAHMRQLKTNVVG